MFMDFCSLLGLLELLGRACGPLQPSWELLGTLEACFGLLVAHAGNGCVWHFDAMGEPKHRIRSCTGLVTTNLAFGGPDNKSLFITESHSGAILKADLPVAGKTMFSHMN